MKRQKLLYMLSAYADELGSGSIALHEKICRPIPADFFMQEESFLQALTGR
ncbi:hypothetical protein [Virgibacillus sp. YIM 98842]|uniref:hypothetical protein n=1 Tax=Virgibacillus sp. YIM 98842 TaxID=2663533 RepID=UPI0013DAB93D|nr:hypothetical protein [Virgibacillus sp. YIM 98842]